MPPKVKSERLWRLLLRLQIFGLNSSITITVARKITQQNPKKKKYRSDLNSLNNEVGKTINV